MDIFILISVLALLSPVALWLAWKNPLYLLVIHLLSRFVLDSMSGVTYATMIGPFSFMQVYSLGFIFLFFIYLLIKGQLSRTPYRNVVFLILMISLISGVVNDRLADFIVIGSKWVYMWICAAMMLYVLKTNTEKKVVLFLMLSILYPLANQYYHFLFTPPKADHNISYLGGFEHESSLAFILLGALPFCIAVLISNKYKIIKVFSVGVVAAIHIGIYFNNYRTALVALAFFWLFVLLLSFKNLNHWGKFATSIAGIVLPLVVIVALGDTLESRFSDIATLLGNPGKYIDFSGHAKQNSLLSGRIDILNTVMATYINAPLVNIIVGLGPGSVNDLIGAYTHNEFVSALIEHGVIGLFALLIVVVSFWLKSYREAVFTKGSAVYISAMLYGFVILAFGTMPFRDTRSMLFLGMFMGFIHWYKLQRNSQHQVKAKKKFVQADATVICNSQKNSILHRRNNRSTN